MKKLLFAVLILACFIGGCSETKKCKVKMYGPDFMTYSGSQETFQEACRRVLHETSHKDSTSYPYYGEGGSTNKNENGDMIALRSHLKTKDSEGFEYSITTVKLAKKEPIVMLETSNPDKFKLTNALMKEFQKSGIIVKN